MSAQFIYFLPGYQKITITPSQLDGMELGHMHDGAMPQCMQGTFAAGVQGLFVAAAAGVLPDKADARIGYKPDEMTWTAGPSRDGSVSWHVGFWNDAKATEADLRRQRTIGGASAKLRDGQDWVLPLAFADGGGHRLPRLLEYDAALREWNTRVAPEYEMLAEKAKVTAEILFKLYLGEPSQLSFTSAMQIVELALGVNYRVSAVELSMLGLIGSAELWAVAEAVCDWGSFRNHVDDTLKKRADLISEPPIAGSGTPADSPTTAPLSAI